jgi:hypothetical protein
MYEMKNTTASHSPSAHGLSPWRSRKALKKRKNQTTTQQGPCRIKKNSKHQLTHILLFIGIKYAAKQ